MAKSGKNVVSYFRQALKGLSPIGAIIMEMEDVHRDYIYYCRALGLTDEVARAIFYTVFELNVENTSDWRTSLGTAKEIALKMAKETRL